MSRSKPQESEQIAIRCTADVMQRTNALMEFIGNRQGRNATKTDVLRAAIMRGLTALENDQEREEGGGGGRRRAG
jgi:hypothetical protein